jgi:hypothetical protein
MPTTTMTATEIEVLLAELCRIRAVLAEMRK